MLTDVLSSVLDAARLESVVHGRFDLTAPWGFRVEEGRAGFYLVTRGSCRLEMSGANETFRLERGDYVVLPQGHAHVLSSGDDARPVPLAEVLASQGSASERCLPRGTVRHGGGGERTILVGGCFKLEDGRRSPLAEALAPVIHVKADGGAAARWLETSRELVAAELASGQPGVDAIISRLADILFIQAVRGHLARTAQAEQGWLRGLVDARIGEALSLMHHKPGESWTVQSLASRVGMSRSAFAARFASVVGEPPLSYLAHLRMQRAARLLRHGRATLAEIAARVGYETEAAFHKAFKRSMGVAPGAYRRAAGSVARDQQQFGPGAGGIGSRPTSKPALAR